MHIQHLKYISWVCLYSDVWTQFRLFPFHWRGWIFHQCSHTQQLLLMLWSSMRYIHVLFTLSSSSICFSWTETTKADEFLRLSGVSNQPPDTQQRSHVAVHMTSARQKPLLISKRLEHGSMAWLCFQVLYTTLKSMLSVSISVFSQFRKLHLKTPR